MKNLIFGLFFFGILLQSCEKNSNNKSDLLVVEGFLFEDEQVDSIRLVKSLPFESVDTVYSVVDDAEIKIRNNGQEYKLNNIGNGYYSYPGTDLAIAEEQTYSLEIDYGGSVITSSTTVPKKTSVVSISADVITIDTVMSFRPGGPGFGDDNSVTVNWENPDKNYYYIVIESTDPEAEDIVMGNSGTSFPGGFPGGRQTRFMFRSEPFIGDTYTINSRTLQKYGEHTVRVYSVNEEYANLYENRSQDSRNLSEPVTNIKNGLGIFTAFSYAEIKFDVKNTYRE
jgi:hypothetical protein